MSQDIQITDPGLQPERTILAWGRTLVSFLVVSAVFLRWLPHYGNGVLVLIVISGIMAGGIYTSQRRRYRKMAHGLQAGQINPDVVAVLVTTVVMLALGICGLALVLMTH